MKYVIFKQRGVIMPVIFPDHVTHSQVTIKDANVTSAGFVDMTAIVQRVHGRSESIGVSSKPEDIDALSYAAENQGMMMFLDEEALNGSPTIGDETLSALFGDEWSEDAPTEPGFYWMYGEASYGSMGGHFSGSIQPNFKMHLVDVHRISNGLMAVAEGRFIELNKFSREKRREGHIGVWRKADLPEVPPPHVLDKLPKL